MEAHSKITLPDLLGLLFVAYKLAGIIAWSWWWVLSPWILELLLAAGAGAVAAATSKE